MAVTSADRGVGLEGKRSETLSEAMYEQWTHWPVNWSAIWTGTLSALAAVMIFGLIGIAIGAHLVDPSQRVVDLKKIALGSLAFSVFASFLAFVIGGWVSGKVAGILRSEPGMLHGAIVWLTALPLLVALGALGAGTSLGAWHAGMSSPAARATDAPYDRPEAPSASATEEERTQYRTQMAEYREQVKQWREDTPRVTRNTALTALTALLLGLIGSVVGGWMASGEPMTFNHNRTRTQPVPDRMGRY